MTTLLLLVALGADPKPVQASLQPTGNAWVGQRQTLVVELWVPTYFAEAAAFDLPTVPGVVLLQSSGSPVIGSQTVGDATYTTQRHEVAIYPLRAGAVRIPAFEVRFAAAGVGGKPATPIRGRTDPVEFTVKLPPGAEGLATLVTTPELTLTETWTPEPGATAKVGDAFTRRVTARAKDVPGLVLPPLRLADVEGLAAYPKPAEVNDHSDRGDLTGERTETIAYVCERPGAVVVPERTLTWWNPATKTLRQATLPERRFEVPAPPSSAKPDAEASPATGWHWVETAIGLAVLGLLVWLLRRRAVAWARTVSERVAAWAAATAGRARDGWHAGELVPLNPPTRRNGE